MLSVVATPIGNLEDITLRAIRTLKEADFVVAEDTRHSGVLLGKYEIKTPQMAFHAHSTDDQLEKLTQLMRDGKHLALISDAGTPGISDPGYRLIQSALSNNIPLTVIPGPSAVVTAVVGSGLPAHRFLYLGFLPLKKGRKKMLESLKDSPYTIVIYEAPHRLMKTLGEINEYLGDRPVAVCRELTKMFEEYFRGSVGDAIKHFTAHKPKGEFTLVIGSEL